jgi:hypothetical protein
MPNAIEVSLKSSAYRTEESYIASVLCHQRSMEEVHGLLPIGTSPVSLSAATSSLSSGGMNQLKGA